MSLLKKAISKARMAGEKKRLDLRDCSDCKKKMLAKMKGKKHA